MRIVIDAAITDYESNICVEFVERTTESRYLHFMDNGNGGCWSYVGRRLNDVNYVSITNCMDANIIYSNILSHAAMENVYLGPWCTPLA